MKRFLKTVVQGLMLVLPLIFTMYILFSFAAWVDNNLRGAMAYIPYAENVEFWHGTGILAGIGLAVVLGLLARHWVASMLVRRLEILVHRVPVIKSLYEGIRDVTGFVGDKRKSFTRSVLVKVPGTGSYVPGFVTRESLQDMPGLRHLEGYLSVTLLAAYGFQGFVLLVKQEDVIPIDMPVGDGLRFVLSGGVSASEDAADPAIAAPTAAPGEGPAPSHQVGA